MQPALAEPDQVQFALLWAGFLGAMLPLVALACSTGINGVTRTCALTGIGLVGTFGRLLRDPAGPIANDEFAHMRQVIETYLDGDVRHVSQLLPISEHFFGLHQTVSAFARLTGSPLWPSAFAVVGLAHVLSVLAVYQLVRAVGASGSGAAAGAVVYTLNPSWMYFDTSVAYESLALPLLLWCLAAAVAASRAPKEPSLRYIAVVVLCAAALPIIHHLTTIMLCLILALLIVAGVVHSVRRIAAKDRGAPREHLWPLLLAASCLLVSMIFWWSKIHDELVAYLSPALTNGWAQLSQLRDPTRAFGKLSGIRTPFAGAQNPIYETVCGLLFPPVVLVLFLASLAVLWRNRRRFGSAPWGFAALGGDVFPEHPNGADQRRRRGSASVLGVQLHRYRRRLRPGLVLQGASCCSRGGRAFWAARCQDRCRGRPAHRHVCRVRGVGDERLLPLPRERARRRRHTVGVPGGLGGRRLDGGARPGRHSGGDRPVRGPAGRFGRPDGPVGAQRHVPVVEPLHERRTGAPAVLKQVLGADVRYFVVDARMATTRPRMGFWFNWAEPGACGTRLFPQVAIDRFNCLPWLRATYAAGPLTVYQVDADVLRRTMAGSCERPDA